jgi:Do/DeqQ family serine protease
MKDFSGTITVPGLGKRAAAVVAALTLVGALGGWYAQSHLVQASTEQVKAPVTVTPRPGVAADSYADLISRVAPAVVTIRAEQMVRQTQMPMDDELLRRFFGDRMPRREAQPRRSSGLGSGVVVTPDGYVLTNEHVVGGAQKIEVELGDGRSFDAKLVGSDKPSDLAVLKIAATGLTTLPLGDSDAARVGDVVFAVGNPLGVGQSVTMGLISAKGRASGGGDGAFEDFIQTDAAINFGNSGGALVNTRGELVGINSQILSPVGYNIGIGFAVPANMARSVMDQLVKTGTVRRGMLGVTVQSIDADMAKSLGLSQTKGAIVSEVTPGTPAAQAGLETGDVILALNGEAVDSSNSLRNHVAPLGPGATATLKVWRDGSERDVEVKLAELPASGADGQRRRSDAPGESGGAFGMSVQPLTPDLARRLGVETQSGVAVVDVDPAGAAAQAGLREGDVITKANGKEVTSVAELRSAIDSGHANRPVLLLVTREGRNLFVTLDRNAD